ncbi:biotin-dependent carboxyltransferase family protein [uncultured Friedmanniella sp.]|uniref:5-oxoprolinase subunit C family protein n=1 Tax=uncultured Friedmanniella sp. TaxID=335381 RepID=UPI0035C95398
MTLTVEATGPLALLQDLGRPGHAHLGVPPSGAADVGSHRLANRLVGNPEEAVTVEVVLGGLAVRASTLVVVAVTGALTTVRVDGRPTCSHCTLTLRPGSRLSIDTPSSGLRSYLAVRGGIAAPATLGSSARDVLSGLGPDPLQAGDELRTGASSRPLPDTDLAPPRPSDQALRLRPGPRLDWFDDAAWGLLLARTWTVRPELDRVAVRLEGPALTRRVTDELPSEGLVRGAVQVPASGQPLVFLADHPVTGGYPVVAVVDERSCDRAAQLRPGDRVRFRGDH